MHDKIKDFKCDKCEFICSSKGQLKQHTKSVHDKIKDCKCDKCLFSCSSNSDLKRHIKMVHDKIKDFKCHACNYAGSTHCEVKQHVKMVHEKIKNVKCLKCEFVCSTNSTLKIHTKHMHDKIKDIKCNQCQYVCSTNGHLKSHIKLIHERPVMDKRMSLGEFVIYTYLAKNNVEFEKEKLFNDLLSPKNGKLRYDFYIQSKNLLIEFDGKQHFQKVRWQHDHTDAQVEEHYNYIVECDHLKNEYADANKIRLYRIKYTDIKNIDNILKVLLQ